MSRDKVLDPAKGRKVMERIRRQSAERKAWEESRGRPNSGVPVTSARSEAKPTERDGAYWKARFDRIVGICQNGAGKSRHSKMLYEYLLGDIIAKAASTIWTHRDVVLKVDSVLDDLQAEIIELRKER